MKTFEEIVTEKALEQVAETQLNEFVTLSDTDFQFLNESERDQLQEVLNKFGDKKVSELDEGIIGSILGGVAGFLVGPAIGKVIANALGIEKGIIYDMLTSRLATAALGAALTKYMGSKK
jgi:uncharacterized membrane protein